MKGNFIEDDSRPHSWSVSTSLKGTTYFKKFTRGSAVTTLGGSHLPTKYWQGYFWPTLRIDSMTFARKCDKCQRFSNILRSYTEKLVSMMSPWPFAIWGIDLIGPLPTVRPAFKYAMVAIDYFTKWAEAKPLATISSKKVQNFVWEAIICQFCIPQEIM